MARVAQHNLAGLVVLLAGLQSPGAALAQEGQQGPDRIAFYGRGSTLRHLRDFGREVGVQVDFLTAETFAGSDAADLSPYRLVVLTMFGSGGPGATAEERDHWRDRCRELLTSARASNPRQRVLLPSDSRGRDFFERELPDLIHEGIVTIDPGIDAYTSVGTRSLSMENLRRLLPYLGVTYLGWTGEIEPPEEVEMRGLYHPDRETLFGDVEEFLEWARRRGTKVDGARRAVVLTPSHHLVDLTRQLVDAVVNEFEKRGVLAVAVIREMRGRGSSPESHERVVLDFEPDVVVHSFSSNRERVGFLERLGVPNLAAMGLSRQSLEEWRDGEVSISAFGGLITAEVHGGIEPIMAGGREGDRSELPPLVPLPERVEHLVDRAVAWVRLAETPNRHKRIALIYGAGSKGSLAGGTPDNKQMNTPRSLVKVLGRMETEGYTIAELPRSEDELIEWMQERGRGFSVAEPEELDRLARSGEAVLLPVGTYREWLEERVPERRREDLIGRWGEPPGRFMAWTDEAGREFIVIPRIDLGNVILLPTPAGGIEDTLFEDLEANLEERRSPPTHNALATRLWLEEEFGADAFVKWGSFPADAFLPWRPVGLGEDDWPDILTGTMPNIRPWIVSALRFSLLARRRTYALLVDHLTPPAVSAGLADELLNLEGDIVKWEAMEEGVLEAKFRTSITEQAREAHLDRDLGLDLSGGRLLEPDEVLRLASWLDEIRSEKLPVSQHVFGEPPRDDLLVPYLVTCLRARFLDGLAEVIAVPPEADRLPGDAREYLRGKAEEIVALVVRQGFTPPEAVAAAGGEVGAGGLPETVHEGLDTALFLVDGFARTHQEIDNLMAALDGRFVPPGPAGAPERNPAVVPTGRNMYTVDPAEIPSRVSWEVGRELVDQMLAEQERSQGRYPAKVAFSLAPRATLADHGVMEAQILFTLGVRPVWDAANRVYDVELIPLAELGRPRIDVFVETYHNYPDQLEDRLRLVDRAIRLVAGLGEPGNAVRANADRIRRELEAEGVPAARAEMLAAARVFSVAPGRFGDPILDELTGLTGLWEERGELAEVYLDHHDYVFTDGAWGEKAPAAYRRQLRDSEVVLRNIVRHGPLAGRAWFRGGHLALAIKHLSGEDPDFLLSDLRDPDGAKVVSAVDALRKDFRAVLFNRKWIEGMMKEGYAGTGQVASLVEHTLAWEITREGSISADVWEEIVEVYLRDGKSLNIREWFDAENPYALHEIAETLLEAARKGYWRADRETLTEIATVLAQSVARHGEGGGLPNTKLEEFIEEALGAPGARESNDSVAEMETRTEEIEASVPTEAPREEFVAGKKMEVVEEEVLPARSWPWVVGVGVVLLFAVGLKKRIGVPS